MPRSNQTDILPHIATVGEQLKDARKSQHLDMAPIALKLCIAQKYLRALEESQYDAFPERVYAYGFLKNYAQALGLDGEELFDQYQVELKRFRTREELPIKQPKMPIPPKRSWLPAVKYIVGGVILIAIVGVSVYFLTNKAPQPVAAVATETVAAEAQKAEEKPTEPEVKQPVIEIKAKKEVWFEIWDDDSLLINKTLKAGESYAVLPEQIGKTLKTNQADRLSITVDGKPVKKSPSKGKLVLNPETLM